MPMEPFIRKVVERYSSCVTVIVELRKEEAFRLRDSLNINALPVIRWYIIDPDEPEKEDHFRNAWLFTDYKSVSNFIASQPKVRYVHFRWPEREPLKLNLPYLKEYVLPQFFPKKD